MIKVLLVYNILLACSCETSLHESGSQTQTRTLKHVISHSHLLSNKLESIVSAKAIL